MSHPTTGNPPYRLYHRQVRRYVNPLAENLVSVKLRVRPGGTGVCYVWYHDGAWSRLQMCPYTQTRRSTYFQAALRVAQPAIRYYFQFVDGPVTCWLDQNNTHTGTDTPEELLPFVRSWLDTPLFTVPAWVQHAVFYQIFPERFQNGDPANDPPHITPWGGVPTSVNFFGGDLQGIIDRVGYLVELGITAVWLNPIFSSPSSHKYNTSDFMQIDPHLGDLETFKRLVDVLHAHNIRLVLDCVFNHTGVDFWAFQDVIRNGPASRYWQWYFVHGYPVSSDPLNYACWWNIPDLPKLNVSNPEVRHYLLDVAAYWTGLGVDGWRLDVPNEMEHSFWVDFRQVVRGINPEAYIVGEIWRDGRPWLRGDQCDAVMNYLFRDLVLDCFARRKMSLHTFDYQLGLIRLRYPEQAVGALLNLLGSHDTARVLTIFMEDLPHGFPTGSAYLEARKRIRPAIIFQMTYQGAPMVYYGDEVGMTGGPDPGCRGTMVWERDVQDRELLALYRRLIQIRRLHVSLRTGCFQTLLADDVHQVYAYLRRHRCQLAVVVLNSGPEDRTAGINLNLPGIPPDLVFSELLRGESYPLVEQTLSIPVPSHDGGVLIAELPPSIEEPQP